MEAVQTPAGHRRYRIAILLALGVLISYFDRVNLSVAHEGLIDSFHVSDVTFGWLLSAYNFTYAICQLPMGLLLDKFGVRRIGRISALLWAAAAFVGSISPNIATFFGGRFLLGVGESPLFPSNAKAIGRWFPRQERSFATALFDSAAKFSSAIGVPLIGILMIHTGWRQAFATTGILSLAYFALFSIVYKEPEDDPKLTAEEFAYIRSNTTQDADLVETAPPVPLLKLLAEPKVIGLALSFSAYNYAFYLLITWLPTYLSRSLGIDLLHSFVYTGFPWLIATMVDLVVGGWMVDRLVPKAKHPGRIRVAVLAIGLVFGLGILGAGHAHTTATALFWITLSIAGLAAAAPVMWSAPSLIAPRQNVATVGSIINFCSQIAAIAAPIVTGYLVARTHSFYSAFGVAAALLVLGVIACLTMLRSIEPMKA